ncbi:DUF58 domain-containing protein [Neosynechococcus sphagnicola]|uniref:DUF58 domain-containing protein n=1 Tax=Neosynechococcus sphagnicola TaxID=1501145 RepID=UPI00068BB19A|nr:DUF58 domain-containing protein [Neosynechococcus sphagnicola]
MKLAASIAEWLETHWANPAYSGWLLLSLAIFFFGAATNTLAGWLYVLSGVIVGLLVLGAILPLRTLRALRIQRSPIAPVSAGEDLTLEVTLHNPTAHPKTLFQVQDRLPYVLGAPAQTVLEVLAPQGQYAWRYCQPTSRRGIYRWQTLELRTGSPLGLFWCRRSQAVPAMAVVYPTVLTLTHCPLVDELGQDISPQFFSRDRRSETTTEGITRSLRPYRWGDSTRLIHWRSSARKGELQVRELEVFTGGQELVIGLDSTATWEAEAFEQAVVAAASLYFYAHRHNLQTQLWTASTGLVAGNRPVLEALAAVNSQETSSGSALPRFPLVWLTPTTLQLATLPSGSRWVLWSAAAQPSPSPAKIDSEVPAAINPHYPGLIIRPDQSLQIQLQAPLHRTDYSSANLSTPEQDKPGQA